MTVSFGASAVPLGVAAEPVRALLAESVARDPLQTVDAVIADIEAGNAVLWLASEGADLLGAVVVQIVASPDHRQCFVLHCAGHDLPRWLSFLSVIESWAVGEGCQSIEMVGRAGWERTLGWSRKGVILGKSLVH